MEFKQNKRKGRFEDVKPSVDKADGSLHKDSDNWLLDDEDWFNIKKDIAKDKEKKHRLKNLLAKLKLKIQSYISVITPRLQKLTKKQKALGLVCVLLIMCSVTILLVRDNDKPQVAGTNNIEQFDPSTPLPRDKPEFPILYPGNKDEKSVGEIVKNSPPNQPASYVYVDTLGGTKIQVSQQALPDKFKVNQDGELQKLAESFQASNVIQVDSVKVYHGSSASGVQSLMFVKGNLLVLIASTQKLSDDAWAAYISALHT